MVLYSVLLILLALLVQGGYFPTVFLLAGTGFGAVLLFSRQRPHRPLHAELLFGSFCTLYLLSSLAAGYDAHSLALAALPLCCLVFLVFYLSLSSSDRTRVLRGLLVGTWVLALPALLCYAGILPLTGGVTGRRLQFTFQYANAAGAWFGAAALLLDGSDDPKLRRGGLPVTVCLLLTLSVGALLTFLAVELVWCVGALRHGDRRWQRSVAALFPAAVFAAGLYAANGWVSALLIAGLFCVGWYLPALTDRIVSNRTAYLCLAGLVCGGAALCFTPRAAQSAGTFFERLLMLRDSLPVIAAHPLLGIGAGRWAALYPYVQSGQYQSGVVHSAPFLIAVGAGLPALLLLLGVLFSAFRQKRADALTAAAAFLCLHSLLDFTPLFLPLDLLLLCLLFAETETTPAAHGAAARILSAAALVLFVFLLGTERLDKRLVIGLQSGRAQDVVSLYERDRGLLGAYPEAQETYAAALISLGETKKAEVFCSSLRCPGRSELLLRAKALRADGRTAEAAKALLDALEARPFDVELYNDVRSFLKDAGAPADAAVRYNALASRANGSVTPLAARTGTQKQIELLSVSAH